MGVINRIDDRVKIFNMMISGVNHACNFIMLELSIFVFLWILEWFKIHELYKNQLMNYYTEYIFFMIQ